MRNITDKELSIYNKVSRITGKLYSEIIKNEFFSYNNEEIINEKITEIASYRINNKKIKRSNFYQDFYLNNYGWDMFHFEISNIESTDSYIKPPRKFNYNKWLLSTSKKLSRTIFNYK